MYKHASLQPGSVQASAAPAIIARSREIASGVSPLRDRRQFGMYLIKRTPHRQTLQPGPAAGAVSYGLFTWHA
jgi:hypothetical protein